MISDYSDFAGISRAFKLKTQHFDSHIGKDAWDMCESSPTHEGSLKLVFLLIKEKFQLILAKVRDFSALIPPFSMFRADVYLFAAAVRNAQQGHRRSDTRVPCC